MEKGKCNCADGCGKYGKLHMIAVILLIIGGLNWLLVGLFSWDIGHLLGGMDAVISRIIYILVGLSAVYELFAHKKTCKVCCGGSCKMNKQDSMSMTSEERGHQDQ